MSIDYEYSARTLSPPGNFFENHVQFPSGCLSSQEHISSFIFCIFYNALCWPGLQPLLAIFYLFPRPHRVHQHATCASASQCYILVHAVALQTDMAFPSPVQSCRPVLCFKTVAVLRRCHHSRVSPLFMEVLKKISATLFSGFIQETLLRPAS